MTGTIGSGIVHVHVTIFVATIEFYIVVFERQLGNGHALSGQVLEFAS